MIVVPGIVPPTPPPREDESPTLAGVQQDESYERDAEHGVKESQYV